MPTITQLPPAASVDPADRLPMDRGGHSLSLSLSLLLQGTQPRLALAQGSLLGRASSGSGGPEPIRLGHALILDNGVLGVDPSQLGGGGSGGSLVGADASAAVVTTPGSTVPRTLAERAATRLDVLDFGADPTGVADSAAAFATAMASIPVGAAARLSVPRGIYRLNSPVLQPANRTVSVEFEEGAELAGPGSLSVDRVDSRQGAYRLSQVSGAFLGFPTDRGNAANLPFDVQVVQNTPVNSGSSRVGWSRVYSNSNRYSRFSSNDDLAEQSQYSWPRLVDRSVTTGHWEVVTGATFDEDTARRAQLGSASAHSEYNIVNNGPEFGWTHQSGLSTSVQGMSMAPGSQSGIHGGNILYSYASFGSFDGAGGGLNQRWFSYPAVHSQENPPPVRRNGTMTIGFDLGAKATANLTANGGIGSVAISNGGGAYTSAPSVLFNGGGGVGAAGTAVVVGGAVVRVSITAAGTGYVSAPSITFNGGGVSAQSSTTLTLNNDGSHGDMASLAAAIRAAAIPNVSATVATWGGVVSRLVVFGTATGDVGVLTLGGSALADLGIVAGSTTTPRDDTAIAFGAATGVTPGDSFSINGSSVTVLGTGAPTDIAAAVNGLGLPGLAADVSATGRLVLTAWLLQQPCGIVLSQPGGATTLGKMGLAPGTIRPPTPPKAFATAAGEIGAPACRPTDAIQISATDLAGTSYGPITVTLGGGGGTGNLADVIASLRGAILAAGWFSQSEAALTAAPAIVSVFSHNAGPTAGLVVRNTAGGTLTLVNAVGTPLDTLGLVGGTYQPGGYSAGSQTVFHAAPNSVAPQGRGVFVGGSSVPDPTVWPHAPIEARGNFSHGLRTDRATFGDGRALLLGVEQAIGWGVAGPTLSVTGGALVSTAPASLPGLSLTALPNSATGLPSGSVWNNGGVLSIA